jgi:predicted fused transcriptional regulator/phosphomethylpyrimidine kinase
MSSFHRQSRIVLRILPDIIYYKGDYGKEPMAVILEKSASEVAKTVLLIAEALD